MEDLLKEVKTKLPKGSNIIFIGISGSTSYGTNTETSDTDYKGIYVQSNKDILNNNYVPQVEINKDCTFYEIRRFLELVSKTNPNCIEMLFLDSKFELKTTSTFKVLKQHRQKFLTKLSFETYSNYAMSQLQKATSTNKKYNWDETHKSRKTIIDFATIFCFSKKEELPLLEWLKENEYTEDLIGLSKVNRFRDSFKLYIDEIKFALDNHRFEGVIETRNYKGFGNGNEPLTSSIEKYMKDQVKGIVYWNREAYSEHCKKYKEYTKWLKDRNEERVATNKKHGQQLDGKNIAHLYRLLLVAEDIVHKNTITVNQSHNRELLLSIKNGEVDLNRIIEESKKKMENLEPLFKNSDLEDCVDKEFVNNLEYQIRIYYG